MSISDDTKFEKLFEHYNDTFTFLQEYTKSRERLFLWALIVVGIMFLDVTTAIDSTKIAAEFIEKKAGIKILIKPSFIGSMLWFFLLSIIVRYFQFNILVRRQYSYIHQLEDNLCVFGGDYFHREGKAYFKDYPVFAKWTWFLYTIVFPALLMSVMIFKVYNEYLIRNSLGMSFFVDIILFVMSLISVLLYWLQIHFKK